MQKGHGRSRQAKGARGRKNCEEENGFWVAKGIRGGFKLLERESLEEN